MATHPPVKPTPNHDEKARQDFVGTLRRTLATKVAPENRRVYENFVEPKFRASQQRAPRDRHEIRRLMTDNPFYQFWSAMQRKSQEMIWESTLDTIERQLPELLDAFRALRATSTKGSLTLDPDLEIPRYHTAADIHLQPGGYHRDLCDDDVTAGALYDMALEIYLAGALGPDNDGLGTLLIEFFTSLEAGSPKRILDMGCAIGNSTLAWCARFPDAEVHAMDVAAPCLRYGHARAEHMGRRVHFSQQNAEQTNFPDGFFDLVVSHIMLHETSAKALPQILRESKRLLAPGGHMLHLDIPRGGDHFEQFMYEWETYNNNENFAGYMTEVDLPALAETAGFPGDHVKLVHVSPPHMRDDQASYSEHPVPFPILVAHQPLAASSAA